MIGKLTGVFERGADGTALIDVGGVGYTVRVPAHVLVSQNGLVSLFVHTAVRDDAIDLYGFTTGEELEFFKLLCSVSGVGPKTALQILNVSDLRSLKRSIAAGDATTLTKVFGIGKKSSERIVVELRDKLLSEVQTHLDHGVGPSSDAEVIEALMALGYGALESRNALKSLGAGEDDVKKRLSAALKLLGTKV